jgi:hypothetical protein
MDQQPSSHRRSATQALPDDGLDPASGGSPVLERPTPRIRSPLFSAPSPSPPHRAAERELPTIPLPPARAFVRPIVAAMLFGIPAVLLISWPIAVVVASFGAIGTEVDAGLRRENVTFAQGFLAFREPTAWPRGVQEEDGVRWRWAAHPGGRHVSRC